MDFKDCKSDTPNTRIAAQPLFEGAVEEASKNGEPVAASKEEEHTARAAVEEHRARVITTLANGDRVTADHRARVISHLNNGDTSAAFQALMRDPNGRQLDYAESRRMYG